MTQLTGYARACNDLSVHIALVITNFDSQFAAGRDTGIWWHSKLG